MSLKKSLETHFGNAEKRIDVLFISTKIVFFIVLLGFFGVYFAISASFYEEIFIPLFLPFYLSFLVSFTLFLCAVSIKFLGKWVHSSIAILACFLCIGMGVFFILPVL